MAPVFADLPSYWETVAEVACPTLLVAGGRSPIVTPADVERYRALLPGIEVVEIEGAGHSVQGDRPRELAQLVQGFLRLGGR
jgi:pimeloyl-ACP methyl ester carboxylesterase